MSCTTDRVGETRAHVYDREIEGFQVYSPDEKRNHPDAGEAHYIYLIIGEEAVRLEGPTLTGLDEADLVDLFEFRSPRVDLVSDGPRAVGLDVVINERLAYGFAIDDFEGEGSVIGRASLTLQGDVLRSEFVFAANGSDGVAHNIVISARIDGGNVGEPTAPVTIETRRGYGDCTEPPNQDIVDLIEPLRSCAPGDLCVPVSAPGDCWHSAVNAADQELGEELAQEIYCGPECATALPSGAVCEAGLCTPVP